MSDVPENLKPGLIRTHELLLAVAASVFMILPLMITISDTVNSFMLQFQAYAFLQNVAAPIEARMLAVVLQHLFGIPTVVSGSTLIMTGQTSFKVYISWICVGWQGAALFAVTALVGLRGPYTMKSKLLVLFGGLEGTYLINLVRETTVILVNMYIGDLAATVYHNYGGALLLIAWLIVFWYVAYTSLLKPK
jgi:exosortase/archaeosortase family protein